MIFYKIVKGLKWLRRIIFIVVIVFLFCVCEVNAQEHVIPDGNTLTTAIAQSDGSIVIDIAPDSGHSTSFNSYTKFNVPQTGVYLNNNVQRVETILNQVTSQNATSILGQLGVLGPKAHVIVANPWGIYVDGGKFVNMSGVALVAGDIIKRPPTYSNILIKTSDQGFINIGANGLSGELSELELIAKQISINGKVENTLNTSKASTTVLAGDNEFEFNTDVNFIGTSPWLKSYSPVSTQSDGIFLVDITEYGSLHGSKMSIIVTDQGAGVKVAGSLGAQIGEINLSADGDIVFEKAEVTAQENLNIVSVSGNIINQAGDLRSTDSDVILNSKEEIINESMDENNLAIMFADSGLLSLEATGDIENRSGRMFSNGDVKIKTAGDFKNITLKNILPQEGVVQNYSYKGSGFWFFRKKISGFNLEYGDLKIKDELALVLAGGKLDIEADEVLNSGGNITSYEGDITIKARDMLNEAVCTGKVNSEKERFIFTKQKSSGEIAIHGGEISSDKDIAITLSENLNNKGGEIIGANVNVNAEQIILESLVTYTKVSLDRGIVGNSEKLLRKDQGGALTANMGYIRLDTKSPTISRGGLISGLSGVVTSQEISEEREAVDESPVGDSIGLFF